MASYFEDLKRLAEMLYRGEITQDEYHRIKADLLAEAGVSQAEASVLGDSRSTDADLSRSATSAAKPFYKRWWFIAVASVLALGWIGSLSGGAEDLPAALGTSTTEKRATTTTRPATTTTTVAPATTTEGREPTTTVALDPEVMLSVWKSVFVSNYMPLFMEDFPEVLEGSFYWIDSVDRVTYDEDAHRLTIDATILFESVYRNDFDEWSADTWDFYRTFSREIWTALVEGFESGGGDLFADWPVWTPTVVLSGNVGRLTVECGGPFIIAVMNRQATQGDFEQQCEINN